MSALAALVLALLGALHTACILWLRREQARDADVLAAQGAVLSADVAALRLAVESLRLQVLALRGSVDATRAEFQEFANGPPSLRRPPMGHEVADELAQLAQLGVYHNTHDPPSRVTRKG